MPIPTPRIDESQDDFVSRCMSDETMKQEYPDQDQRTAVCFSQWRERNKASAVRMKSKGKGELLIYEDIGEDAFFGGMSAKSFVTDLKALGDIDELDVRINSYGGSVWEGVTIYNALVNHKAQVSVYIDGLAASIASLIAMAGDTVTMAPNSMIMVHNPYGMVVGDAAEMRKAADQLDSVKDLLVRTYAKKTELSNDKIANLMNAESWLDDATALSMGFVDNIDESNVALAAYASNALEQYRHCPDKCKPKAAAERPRAKQVADKLAKMRKSLIKYRL